MTYSTTIQFHEGSRPAKLPPAGKYEEYLVCVEAPNGARLTITACYLNKYLLYYEDGVPDDVLSAITDEDRAVYEETGEIPSTGWFEYRGRYDDSLFLDLVGTVVAWAEIPQYPQSPEGQS